MASIHQRIATPDEVTAAALFLASDESSAITGQFSNLANNSVFTNNGITYRASYTGGTGNDLTLTVIPEADVLETIWSGALLWLGGARFRRRSKRSPVLKAA